MVLSRCRVWLQTSGGSGHERMTAKILEQRIARQNAHAPPARPGRLLIEGDTGVGTRQCSRPRLLE
jgi:hypothetical protein